MQELNLKLSYWSKIKLVKRINLFRTRHALRDHNAKMHRTLWFKDCGFLKMYFWKRLHMAFLFPYSLASYLLYLLRNAHFYHRVKIGKLKKVVGFNNCRHWLQSSAFNSVDPSLELTVLIIFTYISVSEVKIFWKRADQDWQKPILGAVFHWPGSAFHHGTAVILRGAIKRPIISDLILKKGTKVGKASTAYQYCSSEFSAKLYQQELEKIIQILSWEFSSEITLTHQLSTLSSSFITSMIMRFGNSDTEHWTLNTEHWTAFANQISYHAHKTQTSKFQ